MNRLEPIHEIDFDGLTLSYSVTLIVKLQCLREKVFTNNQGKWLWHWEVVVAQLAEQSLTIPEDPG